MFWKHLNPFLLWLAIPLRDPLLRVWDFLKFTYFFFVSSSFSSFIFCLEPKGPEFRLILISSWQKNLTCSEICICPGMELLKCAWNRVKVVILLSISFLCTFCCFYNSDWQYVSLQQLLEQSIWCSLIPCHSVHILCCTFLIAVAFALWTMCHCWLYSNTLFWL